MAAALLSPGQIRLVDMVSEWKVSHLQVFPSFLRIRRQRRLRCHVLCVPMVVGWSCCSDPH